MQCCMSDLSNLPTLPAKSQVAGVILAAGASRRLGEAKQLLKLDGRTLLEIAIDNLQPAVDQIFVVVGARAPLVVQSLHQRPVKLVENPDWNQGMSTSVREGIKAVGFRCEAALIAACDQPLVTTGHYLALLAAWRAAPARVVATCYGDNSSGIPAIFPARLFDRLTALTGDRGARGLLHDAATVLNADAGQDIDTRADYEALSALPADRRRKDL